MAFFTETIMVGNSKVLISSTDTTAGYLINKILAGSGITITQENVGGNEDLKISGGTWYQDEIVAQNTTGTSFNLAHSPTSTVFLFLNGKLLVKGVSQDYTISGTAITLNVALFVTDILTATYL